MERLPVNIRAKPGDVAEVAITAGDPARVEQLASMLQDAKLVNKNRGLLVYTGKYRGKGVTVAMHGIGGPSSAIVFEELHMLGAKTIVRLGSCGAMVKELDIGDVVIATGAACTEGSLKMYIPDGILPAVPDIELTHKLIEKCRSENLKHLACVVFSSDAFYAEDPKFVEKWTSRGVKAVEMECATLFSLGLLRGFKTASLLVVSDSLVKPEQMEMVTAEVLKPYVDKAARVVLDVLTE